MPSSLAAAREEMDPSLQSSARGWNSGGRGRRSRPKRTPRSRAAVITPMVMSLLVEKMAVESNPADPESAIADIAKAVPMQRLAKPTEVGELFAFLGSDEASYLTGSQVVIDGGSTLPETMSMGV